MKISLSAIERPRTSAVIQDPALARGHLGSVDDWKWPTGGGRLSQMLAPNQPVRSGLERQQSGVDLAYRGTRPRPEAAVIKGQLTNIAFGHPADLTLVASRSSPPEGKDTQAGTRQGDCDAVHGLGTSEVHHPWSSRVQAVDQRSRRVGALPRELPLRHSLFADVTRLLQRVFDIDIRTCLNRVVGQLRVRRGRRTRALA